MYPYKSGADREAALKLIEFTWYNCILHRKEGHNYPVKVHKDVKSNTTYEEYSYGY